MEFPGVTVRPSAAGKRPDGPAEPPEAACWVCSRPVARFESYGVPPRTGRCPHCGAKPRSRALHRLVRDRIGPRFAAGDRVPEIGPSRFSADHIIGSGLFDPARCVAVDLRRRRHHRRLGAWGRYVAAHAALLAFADASFDFILCNTTPPYVRADRRARAEIARCLKREGLAMIDTHHGPGATRTANAFRREHPGLGEDWFAANGNAWVYGEDFLDRVREAGLEPVEIELFPGAPDGFFTANGLKPRVRALFASRHPGRPSQVLRRRWRRASGRRFESPPRCESEPATLSGPDTISAVAVLDSPRSGDGRRLRIRYPGAETNQDRTASLEGHIPNLRPRYGVSTPPPGSVA